MDAGRPCGGPAGGHPARSARIGDVVADDRPTEPTRWLTPDEQAAWRGLLRLQARLAARLNQEMGGGELSLQDYGVLVLLDEAPDGRLRAFELGDDLGWEKSRLSHHVARMAARGLVTRERCPSDHRGLFVVITQEGRRALTAAAPAHVEAVRRLFVEPLSEEQLAALAGIADSVLGALSASCPPPGPPPKPAADPPARPDDAGCGSSRVSSGPVRRAPGGRAPSTGPDRRGGEGTSGPKLRPANASVLPSDGGRAHVR